MKHIAASRIPLHLAALAALALLPLPRAGAALITWDTPTTIAADSDVSTTGTGLYAFFLQNSASPTTKVVNGVTFGLLQAASGSAGPAASGSVTLSLSGGGHLLLHEYQRRVRQRSVFGAVRQL